MGDCSGFSTSARTNLDDEDGDIAPVQLVRAVAVAFGCLLRAQLPTNLHSASSRFMDLSLAPAANSSDEESNESILEHRRELEQLLDHLTCSFRLTSGCLIHAIILVERAMRAGVPFRAFSCRRLVLAALLLGSQAQIDEVITVADFQCALQETADRSIAAELPSLQGALFVSVLDYHIDVSREMYDMYNTQLSSLSASLLK